MTVKDVSEMAGISVQAVYKKFKANGLKVETLKDKESGHFTPAGEAVVKSLFNLGDKPESTKADEIEALKNEIQRLNESLNQVKEELTTTTIRAEVLTARCQLLENERDSLRDKLDKTLILQLETIRTIPAALPAGEKKWHLPWFKKK
jgi:HAMP domain-containing protein